MSAPPFIPARKKPPEVAILSGQALVSRLPELSRYLSQAVHSPLSRSAEWLLILRDGMKQQPYALEARRDGVTVGVLPLMYIRSWTFGRFLVGLSYLNTGGVMADDTISAGALIDHAVALADHLDVRYLELRHEQPHDHASLAHSRIDKVHMRLELPASSDELWAHLDAKVRNQVRKGQKNGFDVEWRGRDGVADFHDVFSRNMRDLGTPSYSQRFFSLIAEQFPEEAEFCIVRDGGRVIASAMLLHGQGVTEVPSASSLRAYNPTCANMLLYWHLLLRSVERKQQVFDFGRSTINGPTYRFKRQWGAQPACAEWQYYLRCGSVSEMRPDHPRYQRLIAVWQRLPVWVTKRLGPFIVRGIP